MSLVRSSSVAAAILPFPRPEAGCFGVDLVSPLDFPMTRANFFFAVRSNFRIRHRRDVQKIEAGALAEIFASVDKSSHPQKVSSRIRSQSF
jgi:hypothetical protein